jgi:hypothetical protein
LKFGSTDVAIFASSNGNEQIEWNDIDDKLIATTKTA